MAPYSAVSNPAEDARIALPGQVVGQGVSVAASRQFVVFLSLKYAVIISHDRNVHMSTLGNFD